MSSKSKRKVTFSPIGTVTKTVELGEDSDIEPFDFTFEIPSPGKTRRAYAALPDDVIESNLRIEEAFQAISKLNMDEAETKEEAKRIIAETSTKDNMNFEEVALTICGLCVKSWTLDAPCDVEHMERLDPQGIVSAMYATILVEIAARKN